MIMQQTMCRFVFLFLILLHNSVQAQSNSKCDIGWHENQGICYLFTEIKSSWMEAINYCKLFQSTLLEINSPSEQQFITNTSIALHRKASLTFQQKVAESYWIGLNDIEKEGHYYWASEHQQMTYTYWAPGEPVTDPGLNSDCVELAGHFNYMWNDAPCDAKIHFICEKESEMDNSGIIIG